MPVGATAGKVVNYPQDTNMYGSGNNLFKLYNSAVGQNAEDYSGIMQGYRDILNRTRNPAERYNPQMQQYTQDPELTNAIKNLRGLSETGGYSEEGIRDLRARGIAPIRSVYANAQRNIARSKALAGGYSPNYNATTAKLTRELSEGVANATQNVNAGIAQNVAQNRLQIAPTYASTTGRESELQNQIMGRNVDRGNEGQQFNISNSYKSLEEAQNALRGMTSLYGTTPALSELFGRQAGLPLPQNTQGGNDYGLQLVTAMLGRR